MTRGHGVPSTYVEYLRMLHDVPAECVRVLEPGGRGGQRFANLGRKPYRSLAGDVTWILQDDLGLPSGQRIWIKGRASRSPKCPGARTPRPPVQASATRPSGSCSPARGGTRPGHDPRAMGRPRLPHELTITAEESRRLTSTSAFASPRPSGLATRHPSRGAARRVIELLNAMRRRRVARPVQGQRAGGPPLSDRLQPCRLRQ